MKYTKFLRVTALIISLVMMLGAFAGCKKSEDEYSYYTSEIVLTEEVDGEGGEGSSGDSDGSGDITGSGNKPGNKPGSTQNQKLDLGGRTITYMTWWEEPAQGTTPQAVEYWQVKTQVEKEYNCKFKFVFVNDGGWLDRITASILAGDPICDIFSTEYQHFWGMQKAGMLYPVSDLKNFDFSQNKKWWNPGMEYSKVNGKQYGMCLSGAEFSLILYNKNLLKQNNQPDLYTLQKQGKLTWSKIVEIAKACTNVDKGIYGMGPKQFPRDLLYLIGGAYGGKIVSREGDSLNFKTTVNSTAMVNAFNDVNKWYTVDKIVAPVTGDYTDIGRKFDQGKIAMYFDVSAPTYYNGGNFEIGACLMPSGRDAKSFTPYINMSTGVLSYIPICVNKPEEVAAVWNRIGEKTGRVNWELFYQDYLPEEIMDCLYESNELVRNKKYTVDYGHTLVSLWDSGNATFDATNAFVASQNSAASLIQSLEGVYNSKVLDMKQPG